MYWETYCPTLVMTWSMRVPFIQSCLRKSSQQKITDLAGRCLFCCHKFAKYFYLILPYMDTYSAFTTACWQYRYIGVDFDPYLTLSRSAGLAGMLCSFLSWTFFKAPSISVGSLKLYTIESKNSWLLWTPFLAAAIFDEWFLSSFWCCCESLW